MSFPNEEAALALQEVHKRVTEEVPQIPGLRLLAMSDLAVVPILASGWTTASEQSSDSLDPNPTTNLSPNYVFIRGVSYPWCEYKWGRPHLYSSGG